MEEAERSRMQGAAVKKDGGDGKEGARRRRKETKRKYSTAGMKRRGDDAVGCKMQKMCAGRWTNFAP